MSREDRFVERLLTLVPRSDRVWIGPGDDAAIVRVERGELVATTDLLVESVDFLPGEPPEALGRRAVAVNCSDLAAMGASPDFFLLGIAFRAEGGEEFPLAVARGAVGRAADFGGLLVGGDLSRSAVTMIAVSMWGRLESRPLLRRGASPGDLLFLSGLPGRAAAGLQLARERRDGLAPEAERELLAAYRDPEPRVDLGKHLAREGLATAAIDVSDGLGIDAARLARASGIRAVVERDRLPVSSALEQFASLASADPLDMILSGGDDYELLFSAPPGAEQRLTQALPRGLGSVARVGRVEPGEGAVLEEQGRWRDISGAGHDHFETRS